MGKELLLVASALSNEKGVSEEIVIDAIQLALESATRKKHDDNIAVRVDLDKYTGDYVTYRYWEVVADEDLYDPEFEVSLTSAKADNVEIKIGDKVEKIMESVEFGRIAAQTAKQVIFKKVREAEREKIIAEYTPRIGEMITGIVKRVTKDYIILDLGNITEALLYRSEMLAQDIYRLGDRVRAVLTDISTQDRGPQLFVSRTHANMLIELFKIEVPEIGENIIEVKGAARDAGNRAKIAVTTNDGRIDPIGACVGMRGSRVQAVSGELGGERIDIILWDSNPAQLVINAMAPAEVVSIVVDEETNTMDIAVTEEQLSQAIGKNGQNIRLASELTKWILNVMSEDDFAQKSFRDSSKVVDAFVEDLDVDIEIAKLLADYGFTTLEEVAYVEDAEFLKIEEFDEEMIAELRSRANDALLAKAFDHKMAPETALSTVVGLNDNIVSKLAEHQIITVDDFADQSVNELIDILPDIDNEVLAKLIMKARKNWFNN